MSIFEEISESYRMHDSLSVCSDVTGLMEELRFQHVPEEPRIFI
jgi:hypothetical protein